MSNDKEWAAGAVDMINSCPLEREAVALIKQYGLFLPAPAKTFFRKLAVHLNWQALTKAIK